SRVDDESDAAVSKDRSARDAVDLAKDAPKRLDDHLLFSFQGIYAQAEAGATGPDDDDVRVCRDGIAARILLMGEYRLQVRKRNGLPPENHGRTPGDLLLSGRVFGAQAKGLD